MLNSTEKVKENDRKKKVRIAPTLHIQRTNLTERVDQRS